MTARDAAWHVPMASAPGVTPATPPAVWVRADAAHVRWFQVHVLAPLIAATRPRDLATRELVDEAAKVWIVALADVPADVLLEAVRALVRGSKWMPKPFEVREACAAVVERRRLALGYQAKAARAACDRGCSAEGWLEVPGPGGVGHVVRCECRKAAERVLAAGPTALALPPARETEATE